MDIQGSNNSSRVGWQPASGASGTRSVTGSKAEVTSAGDDVGFPGEAKAQTMQATGLTGTGHSILQGPPLQLPTKESVAADTEKMEAELRIALSMAGIKSDPPIAFRVQTNGRVTVDGSDPRAAAVNEMLARDRDLETGLHKLVCDAQFIEQSDAIEGFYSQVNAGADPDVAIHPLKAAQQKIGAASGFTMDVDGKLSFECSGMGKELMPPAAEQVSDEEKMWREMMRLTDRTRRTGVVAAAEDAEAAEKKDRDRREGTGDNASNQPDLGQNGAGGSGTAKAAA